MKRFAPVLLLIIMLFMLGSCGSGDSSKGGDAFVGRWEANVKNGFQTQVLTYDIRHKDGNEYTITRELDGLKQALVITAVYEDKAFKVAPWGDEAVLDGNDRMLLQGMDFKKVK